MQGAVFAANIDDVEYIKFVGTVRYTQCAGLEAHIDLIFKKNNIRDVVIELQEAEMLDSTALGLIAKIAIELRKVTQHKPIIFVVNNELIKMLKRVCFDQVFELVYDKDMSDVSRLTELTAAHQSEQGMLRQVLRSHQQLVKLAEQCRYHDVSKMTK